MIQHVAGTCDNHMTNNVAITAHSDPPPAVVSSPVSISECAASAPRMSTHLGMAVANMSYVVAAIQILTSLSIIQVLSLSSYYM